MRNPVETAARASPGWSRVPRWAAALGIVVAGAVAYLPALRGGFVFDDHVLIEDSRLLRGPLWRIWLTSTTTDYWPLTWTAFWAEWRAFGADPVGYHAVNLALHLGAALLLWRVLRRLTVPGAWLAALLFAVHPVAVESVAWISETKNTLSALLFLAAIGAWLRFEEGRRARPYLAALAWYLLAALAKASVVFLPVVLLGLALWRRGKLERRDAVATVPFFAASFAVGVVNVGFQHRNAMVGGWAIPRGVAERVGEAGWAIGEYLRTAFVPVRLAFVHPAWPATPGTALFWVPPLALALLAAVLVALRARSRAARAALPALGYHLLAVLPVVGFVDLAYLRIAPVSNHLQYLALMGPVALVGAGLTTLARRSRAAVFAAAVIPVALAAATFERAAAFQDDLVLWEAAVRDAPGSAFSHVQLSGQLADRGRHAEALAQLEAASEVAPEPGDQHRYRALFLLHSRHTSEAIAEARAALGASRDPEVRRDAAYVLAQAGAPQGEAVEIFRALAAEAPNSSDYAYWLAATLARAGQVPEATAVLARWCEERPGHPQMEKALAVLLARTGRLDEARSHAAAAIETAVDDPRVLASLAAWTSGRE